MFIMHIMWLALMAVGLLWGLNWVVMKLAGNYFHPLDFVTLRFGCGAVVLVLACLLLKKKIPERRFWFWIVLTGIIQYSCSNLLVQLCVGALGAGLSAVISYTMPIWVAIMANFVLDEKLNRRKVTGILTAFLGLLILMQVKTTAGAGTILLALLGAILWGLASVLTKWKLSGNDAMSVTAWQMAAGALALCLFDSLGSPGTAVVWNLPALLCLGYNVFFATSLAFFLWTYVLAHMEAGKAAISIMAVPPVGILAGVIFLGEPLALSSLLGMVMVLAGILLVEKR